MCPGEHKTFGRKGRAVPEPAGNLEVRKPKPQDRGEGSVERPTTTGGWIASDYFDAVTDDRYTADLVACRESPNSETLTRLS